MWTRISLALFSVALVRAQTSGTAEQLAQRMTIMHNGWGVKASTPNVSLTIVEESKSGADFRYGLRANGIPLDAVFILVSWPVTQRDLAPLLQGVTVDSKGTVVCAGRSGTCGDPAVPNDPIHLPFRAVPGEPIRLGLISTDGSIKAFAKTVPLPLQGEDKACRMSATLLTPGAELLFLEGTGFPPNTPVTIDSDSEGEKHLFNGKADEQGRYISALMPYKQGLSHGTVKIILKGDSCAPAVSVPWGKRL